MFTYINRRDNLFQSAFAKQIEIKKQKKNANHGNLSSVRTFLDRYVVHIGYCKKRNRGNI